MTIHGGKVYEIQDDKTVIGLVRAVYDQGNVPPGSSSYIRLSVDPEHDIPQKVRQEGDKIMTTVLDVGDPVNWDPTRDNFYPFNRGHIIGSSKKRGGDYKLRLNFNDNFVKTRKNTLYYLCSKCDDEPESGPTPDYTDTPYSGIIEEVYE